MKIVFFLFSLFSLSVLLQMFQFYWFFYITSYFFHFLSFLHFQLHWFFWLWFPSGFGFTFVFLWSWVGFRLLTWNFSSVVLYIYIYSCYKLLCQYYFSSVLQSLVCFISFILVYSSLICLSLLNCLRIYTHHFKEQTCFKRHSTPCACSPFPLVKVRSRKWYLLCWMVLSQWFSTPPPYRQLGNL